MTSLLKLKISDQEVTALYPNYEVSSLDLFEENINQSFISSFSQPQLLPAGVAWVNQNATCIVFERPPTYKDISYCPTTRESAFEDETDTYYYNLPLPWQIYIAEYWPHGGLANIRMFFSDSAIDTVTVTVSGIDILNLSNTPLLSPSLPNIYGDYHFCIDNEISYTSSDSLEHRILGSYNAIWDTTFNNDLMQLYNEAVDYASINHRIMNDPRYDVEDDAFPFLSYWSRLSLSEILHTKNILKPILSNNIPALDVVYNLYSSTSFTSFVNTLQRLI